MISPAPELRARAGVDAETFRGLVGLLTKRVIPESAHFRHSACQVATFPDMMNG